MSAMNPCHYVIRVAGTLPPEALADFEDLTVRAEPASTLVQGTLRDQAALSGLLARLELLGVQVDEVRRLHDRSPER